ncbi:MAG: Nramp family divalent metal transporter [Phycisphaerales bacterium]|nr:Nramp family divalent metal transporter [Phycisphaerales bacterium]
MRRGEIVDRMTDGPHPSLEGLHDSVAVPKAGASFWRQYLAFAGPALLVSVGYMDPGNWATDLEGGARYRYGLLWVVALSSMMAIILQICSARLGVVAGKDLAQACRDFSPKWTRWPNWLSSEVAIAACDLAEVLGSAVAINLLFGIPLIWAVVITAFDVILLLSLQSFGMRLIEAFILVLVMTIAGCYFIEIFVLPATKPSFMEMGQALITPGFAQEGMIYVAIGIIGATVMPHNLYLHGALVQTRRFQKDEPSIRRAIWFNSFDSVISLSIAFMVNASIMVLAAITFYGKSHTTLPGGEVVTFGNDWIQEAYLTLAPLLGTAAASVLFAVALLASGQSSTVTGTLAGQVVMEGFMHWRIRPWVRRMITRLVAIVPAIVVIAIKGDQSVTALLTLSQVILGIQLPLAMFPLLQFTSSKRRMGKFANGWFLLIAGWGSCLLITALDVYGLGSMLIDAITGH